MKSLITLYFFFFTIGFCAKGQDYKISYQCIEWMPNGKQILFTAIKVMPDWSDYSPDKWRLYQYDLESRKLTVLDSSVLYFSISKKSDQIVCDRILESGKDIYIYDLNKKVSNYLVVNPGKDAGPVWSPTGKQIVFYSDRDGNEELFTINIKTGQVNQLTKREEHKSYNPQWSPNSELIVYYLEKGDSKDQIYLTNSKGSFQKNLTNDEHHNIFPSWTPDGRIIYLRDKGEAMIMNADGSEKRQLIRNHEVGLIRMDITGSKVLFADREGNLRILHLDDFSSELVVDFKMF